MTTPFGLYYHIPFCRALCHYCDFNKTARWDEGQVTSYFAVLCTQTAAWFAKAPQPITSVFFGGGTPGLFAKEYETLFALWRSQPSITEITLEANPLDLTREHLQVWKDLGVTRISVGVQSFSPQGLTFLTRDHSPEQVLTGVALAQEFIPNINIDLIYGWQGQTLQDWQHDLAMAVSLQPKHLSLYNLTYAPQTPIGRAFERGKIKEQEDTLLEAYYLHACDYLAQAGFDHDEISNWAKPGFSCAHNHLYWQDGYFLGIGAGACGYVPDGSHKGLRYRYHNSLKAFLRSSAEDVGAFIGAGSNSALQVDERGEDAWLTEYVACGLRCALGLDLQRISKKSGLVFTPTPVLLAAREQGLVQWSAQKITLRKTEWFREGYWAMQILEAFSR